MGPVDDFILRVKRAETPFYARLKSTARRALRSRVPLPLPWIWFIIGVQRSREVWSLVWMRICVMLYREPLFRRRCVSVGENLQLELLPSVSGHVRITVGDNVMISGALGIGCARVCDTPELVIGNNVFIGHQVILHPNKSIVIEDDVLIAGNCFITDSNEHPIDMGRRIRGDACTPDEIRPVIIRRGAWLGKGSVVLRGVEIGEGAIVGAGSVVSSSVPPFTIAAGNPARHIRELTPIPENIK
jgi:carbonic anhydrase/acetyltransferase-like protein (isoleucine patch superfamily)